MSGLPAPACIPRGYDELAWRVIGTCVCIKHAVTLESRHQKGELQCLIKMCVPLSKPLQTVLSIPLGSLSLLMWFLEFLLFSSLLIFAEITLPLSVLQTKCPVWGSELNITDRWVPAVTLTLYSKVSPQSHHPPPRHARGRSHEWLGKEAGRGKEMRHSQTIHVFFNIDVIF